MVEVEVRVAEGVDELSRLKVADLRHHHGQERVAGDVEGHAKKAVGRTLVELQREFPFANVELEEGMAGV